MNITYVSCLYNIYNDTHFNPILEKNVQTLLDHDLNIIIYTDSFFHNFLSQYRERLKNAKIILLELSDVEIYKKIVDSNANLPAHRNPNKDTKAYMGLMNSKLEFMRRASFLCSSPFLAWIDLGISKIFKDPQTVFSSLKELNIRDNVKTVIIPGPYKIPVNMDLLCNHVYWLFCGGFFVCNRNFIQPFYNLCFSTINAFIQRGFIVWEVNIWAFIYTMNNSIFLCYTGDHNDTIINIPGEYLIKSKDELELVKKREAILGMLQRREFSEAYDNLSQIYEEKRKEYPLLNEDMFVACYYLGKFYEGRIAFNRLLFSNSDNLSKVNAIKNYIYYVQKLDSDRQITDITPFNNTNNIFNPSSPSVFIKDGITYFNIRCVNYSILNTGAYSIRHQNNHLETKNFLSLNKYWENVVQNNYREIFASTKCMNPYPMHIKGLEDMRIFDVKDDKLYCFATCCECRQYFVPRIVFACYDLKTNREVFIKELNLPDTEIRCEKNWLPFVDGDEIKFIYSMNPLKIYSIDKNMNIRLIKNKPQPNYHDMRGSAAPIPYKNGWLFTVHQIEDSTPRKYYHRLVWYDKDFENIKFSDLFYFNKIGIEFNLGISMYKDSLLFSYSVNDGSANVCSLHLNKVDNMLEFSKSL